MALKALDFEEIKQLTARFAQSLDFGDPSGFAACFAVDGVFTVDGETYEGEELGRYAAEKTAKWGGHFRHTEAVSPLIDGGGNMARALSYGCYTRDYGAPVGANQTTRSGPVLSGVYEDILVRIDGSWLFASRTFHRDASPAVLGRVGRSLEIEPVNAGPASSDGGLTPLDYEAIRQLTTRYGYTLDFSDEHGFVDCFMPDGYFEIKTMGDPDFDGESRIEGSKGLREMCAFMAPRLMGHVRHGVMNAVIEGSGERATVSSYGFFTMDRGQKARPNESDCFEIETTGIYRDEVVKKNGYWRFAGRTFRYDGWPDVTELVGQPMSTSLWRFASN
ncbi:nuclear transport factor 2 family protein [Pseudarthrobacter phenanthrenivorans]|uniref:nuclear transport factor 2 family protein n=1 Tax=Pseudarthrobacter phenanthrenivorans TaxID=361575 RepID=UPI00344BDAEE